MAQTPTPGGEALESGRPDAGSLPLAFHLFVLVATLLPALPLVADWVAAALGWQIFFLADGRIQSIFASAVLLAGGWPLVSGLRRRRWSGPSWAAAGLSLLVAMGLYAYGLYRTYRRPDLGSHDFFQAEAAVLLGVAVLRLANAMIGRLPGRHRPLRGA